MTALMEPPMERQEQIDEDTLSEACTMIRRRWMSDVDRRADPEAMLAASILAHDADSLDSISEHLKLLVEYRNSAQHCIKLFKAQLALAREKIVDAQIALNWIKDKDTDGPTLRLVCEALDKDEETVVSRLLKMLDKQTYYYLVGLKGSRCPLCSAEQGMEFDHDD